MTTNTATTRDDASDPAFLGQGATAATTAAPSSFHHHQTIPSASATGYDNMSNFGTHLRPPSQLSTLSATQSHSLTYPAAPSGGPSSPETLEQPLIQVMLTHDALSLDTAAKFIGSPSAGANVFFTGTTRNTFASRTVTRLEYTAYPALALRTMLNLCRDVLDKHHLNKVYLVHRLGVVGVGQESIIIGVSSPHRKAAWQAGEELLESVKQKVEVWKREWFLDGDVVVAKDGEAASSSSSSPLSPAPQQSHHQHHQQQRKSTLDIRSGDSEFHHTGDDDQSGLKERGEWRANANQDGSGHHIPK